MTTLAVAKVPPPQFQVITLVGNLTADLVLRTVDENRKVCDMRLAVNDQKDQPPLFIDVATFGASAEARAKSVAKGRAIAVIGRLIYREWEAEHGTRRSKHAVVGRLQFSGRPDGDHPAENDRPGDNEASFLSFLPEELALPRRFHRALPST